jgi:hypothetical protein
MPVFPPFFPYQNIFQGKVEFMKVPLFNVVQNFTVFKNCRGVTGGLGGSYCPTAANAFYMVYKVPFQGTI